MALKIKEDREQGNFFVYEGSNPRNRSVIFIGSKNQCLAYLSALGIPEDFSPLLIEKWVNEKRDFLNSLEFDDIDLFVSIEGRSALRKLNFQKAIS